MPGGRFIPAVAGFIAVFVAACGGASSGTTEATTAPMPHIVVSIGANTTTTDADVAVSKGFFRKHGIDAELKTFANGNDALDLILSGQADIGDSTEAGGLVRRAKGGKIYVAGAGAASGNANALVGKESITKPQDLIGKKVGFPVGSSANYFFFRYVQKYGLDASKITTVNGQPPELLAALNRGDIDAFFLWDPWPSKAVASIPKTRVIADSGTDGVYVAQQYFYFSQRMIDDKALGVKAMKALIEANAWIKNNLPEASKIAAKDFQITEAEAMTQLKQWSWGEIKFSPTTKSNIQAAAQFLIASGQLKEVPDLNTYLQPGLLKEANPAAVTV